MTNSEIMLQLSVLIILLASAHSETELDFKVITGQIGTVLCPYSNFCHFNASDELENDSKYQPCCEACSCEDSCFETETCCPDKTGVATQYAEQFPMGAVCKSSATKSEPSKEYDEKPLPYLIYDTCSDNSPDFYLNEKCGGVYKANVEDYNWVSDKETGRIYQNIYCATCNGVKEWVPWKIRTTCQEVKTADFDGVTDILLNPKCDIINVVPEEFQETIRKYRCFFPDRYSSCNMSGQWEFYDAYTYAACETFNLPFYQDSPRGGLSVVYKNIFCYICNKNIPLNWATKTCKSLEDSSRNVAPTFTAIINFVTPKDAKVDKSCAASEVYDTHMHRCRRLYCPFGQASIQGKCQRLFSLTLGISVYFLVELDIVSDQTAFGLESFQKDEIDELLSKVYADFYGRLMLNNCSMCYYALCTYFGKPSISERKVNLPKSEMSKPDIGQNNGTLEQETSDVLQGVLISIQFTTSKACQSDFIVEKFFNVIEAGISISLNNHSIVFSTSLRDVNETARPVHNFSDCYGEKFQLSKTYINNCELQAVKITKKPCPEYRLEYSEVTSLPHGTKRTLMLQFFDPRKELNETSAVNVCINHYNEIMALKNGISRLPTSSMELPLGFITLSMLSML